MSNERENLSCKVLSVMMRPLNSFNCFSFGNESLCITFSWDFIESNNLNVLTLKVKGFKLFFRFLNPAARSFCSIEMVLK